jgi:DNA polymerase-3 subunit delta'
MAAAGYRTRGQPAALGLIARAVATERAPGSLLIAGPPRVGKTTLALDLAAGLLCLADDPAGRPCRACLACQKVERGSHPDVHRLAPSGAGAQIRIDEARRLVVDLALLPAEGRVRVAIVSAADRLNPDAQNALLKILEEPPAGAVLVLCADDETLLLDTVRSRCARVRTGPVAASVIAQLLVEQGHVDAAAADAIARVADGRPGLALALAATPDILIQRAGLTRTLLDLVRAGRRERLAAAGGLLAEAGTLAEAMARRPDDAAVSSVPPDEASRSADGPGRAAPAARRAAALALIETWRDVARDLVVVMAGGASLVRDVALLEDLERAATGLTLDEAAAFLARLDSLAAAVEAYANAELVVDVLLLAWPRARLAA